MHFYVVYTRPRFLGDHLYAFLCESRAPGAICMHFYMERTPLRFPGDHLYVFYIEPASLGTICMHFYVNPVWCGVVWCSVVPLNGA